jgi:hypothetical protein
MSKLVDNEKWKMASNFMNNLAVASFSGGGLLPLFALSAAGRVPNPLWHLFLPPVLGWTFGLWCRWRSHAYLNNLQE